MIYDCIMFNGEADLFSIRYEILKNFVDEFVVLEFNETFSGNPKPFYFEKEEFIKWPKVKYFKFTKEYEKYLELAESSPNTKWASHWKREFAMKEMLKDCLTHLKDDDIVFIGDCDEIWNPEFLQYFEPVSKWGIKIPLYVYTYYLNNKSSEVFWGNLVSRYGNIKNQILNHLRSDSNKPVLRDNSILGWHFTSLKDRLERKLKDSYTEESYATPAVLDSLKTNIENNRDFLGRDFTYTTDESDWPPWLKENKEKYLHLLK